MGGSSTESQAKHPEYLTPLTTGVSDVGRLAIHRSARIVVAPTSVWFVGKWRSVGWVCLVLGLVCGSEQAPAGVAGSS